MNSKYVEPPLDRNPRLHRDRTVSYWSRYQGMWIPRSIYVPEEEIEQMRPRDRERVRRHLGLESATA